MQPAKAEDGFKDGIDRLNDLAMVRVPAAVVGGPSAKLPAVAWGNSDDIGTVVLEPMGAPQTPVQATVSQIGGRGRGTGGKKAADETAGQGGTIRASCMGSGAGRCKQPSPARVLNKPSTNQRSLRCAAPTTQPVIAPLALTLTHHRCP